MKRTVQAVLLTLPILACMLLIYSFSAETAAESTQTSSTIIETVLRVLVPDFDTLPSAIQRTMISSLQFATRKGAHFSVYALLGALSLQLTLFLFPARRPAFICAWLIPTIYAVTDELHQLHVPGRSGEIRDILIDSIGAILGVFLGYLLHRCVQKIKQRKTQDYEKSA